MLDKIKIKNKIGKRLHVLGEHIYQLGEWLCSAYIPTLEEFCHDTEVTMSCNDKQTGLVVLVTGQMCYTYAESRQHDEVEFQHDNKCWTFVGAHPLDDVDDKEYLEACLKNEE